MMNESPQIYQLKGFADELAVCVARLLAVGTFCPKWDSKQAWWRHDSKEGNIPLFLLLKLAGSVSAVNAMLALADLGFWFEAAVLARTIYDASLSIAFMLPAPDAGCEEWPSRKQQEALDAFFMETWEDPERPFEEPRQRSQILIKDLKAGLARFQSKTGELNPHDAGQTALQMMRFLSDYTHMAYPRLMEFLDGGHGYRLNGEQPTASAFGISGAAGALLYCVYTADSVSLFMARILAVTSEHAKTEDAGVAIKKLAEKAKTVSSLQVAFAELCSRVEALTIPETASPQKMLRTFKGK